MKIFDLGPLSIGVSRNLSRFRFRRGLVFHWWFTFGPLSVMLIRLDFVRR